MKIINKIQTLKRKTKIIIFITISCLIALLNFLFYNYQVFKLKPEERNYNINLKELENLNFNYKNNRLVSNNENSSIKIDFHEKYIKNIIINYDINQDIKISYTGKTGNAYGIMQDYNSEDTCYSFLNNCGKVFNKKVGELQLIFNANNITINSIKVVSDISFNYRTFFFWLISINLMLLLIFENKFFTSIFSHSI